MASISQILRGGSFTPLPGGGWKFDIQIKTKFHWERAKKKIGETNARQLKIVGNEIRSQVKNKVIGSRIPKQPRQWKIANRHGFQLVALVTKVPAAPPKIISWRTSRNPQGFLKSRIEYDYDSRTKSVVVGPIRRAQGIFRLQHDGGAARYWFKPIPTPRALRTRRENNRVYGKLVGRRPNLPGSRIPMAGLYSFTRTLRPRPFMSDGVARAFGAVRKDGMPKLAQMWRDKVKGP